MALEQNEEEIIVVRTLECDMCQRFDSIMLTDTEVERRVYSNQLSIGSHIVNHSDHVRIIYFDVFGVYLGDTISLNVNDENLRKLSEELPKFQKVDHPL